MVTRLDYGRNRYREIRLRKLFRQLMSTRFLDRKEYLVLNEGNLIRCKRAGPYTPTLGFLHEKSFYV